MFTNKSEVTLIDYMGSDLTVVNAARVSFNKQKNVLDDKDTKLIKYLAEHKHWTPFAHVQLTFKIKTPIFVARQLHKHQVGLVVNEVSRRYVTDPPEFFIPYEFRGVATDKKQGSAGTIQLHKEVLDEIEYIINAQQGVYKELLRCEVCPEQARMFLPQNLMTEFYWTGSLVAFARVINLRLEQHAQKETQDVASDMLLVLDEIETLQHSLHALIEY